MANRHFYFLLENLTLSGDDWDALAGLIKQRGANDDPQPCNRNHWRYRLDNQAVIFEALFNESAVNANAIKGLLTAVTQIPANRIDYTTDANITTFTIDDVESLGQIVFGGDGAEWNDSRLDCLAYLSAYRTAWEPEPEEEPEAEALAVEEQPSTIGRATGFVVDAAKELWKRVSKNPADW